MGVDLDVNNLALVRLALNYTAVECPLRHCDAARGWSEQGHEGGHVVGADIKQRAGARLVKEVGSRMEPLVAMADDKRARRRDFADRSVVDQFAASLKACSKDRVRSAADHQTALFGEGQDALALCKRRRQRFL